MNEKRKSVSAFISGLFGGLAGIIGGIVVIAENSRFLLVAILLLIFPSVLIIVGAGLCLDSAFIGGILCAVGTGFYLIGVVVCCFRSPFFTSIIAFPIISAALVSAFANNKSTAGYADEETDTAENGDEDEEETSEEYGDGEEIMNETVKKTTVCTVQSSAPAVNVLSVLGLIFSFLIPILGLLFGISGLNDAKKYYGGRGAGMGLSSIIISSAMILIYIVILIVAVVYRTNV